MRTIVHEEALTLPRLRAFVAFVDEHGVMSRAANAVGQTPSAMRQNLKALKDVYSGRVLWEGGSDRGSKITLTDLGEDLLRRARRMVHEWEGMSRLGDDIAAVAFLPQHAFFISPMIKQLREEVQVRPHVLGEQDRNSQVFEDHVIGSLRAGAIDLVVGPPAKSLGDPPELEQTVLYRPRLEAMVPVTESSKFIEVTELLRQGNLLLPPPETRSTRTLAAAVADLFAAPKTLADEVFLEAYGTKVLVTFGRDGHGTVVVPSDIAYPFKTEAGEVVPAGAHILGGIALDEFKWIPLALNGEPLAHDVMATTRVRSPEQVKRIVNVLKSIVEELELNVGRLPLAEETGADEKTGAHVLASSAAP